MRNILGLLLFILQLNSASAVFHFEPILGFEMASTEQKSSLGTYKGSNESAYIGLRIGPSYPGLSIGLEAIHGSGSFGHMTTYQNPNSNFQKGDESYTNFGPFLMVRLLDDKLHIWGTYFLLSNLSNEGNLKAGGGYSKYRGTGISTGVGYVMMPYIAVNFDISKHTYDEYEFSHGQGTPKGEFPYKSASETLYDMRKLSFRLSLSFPIIY